MKIIDRIVLNRIIIWVTAFVLGVLKLLRVDVDKDGLPKPPNKRNKILPWRK